MYFFHNSDLNKNGNVNGLARFFIDVESKFFSNEEVQVHNN